MSEAYSLHLQSRIEPEHEGSMFLQNTSTNLPDWKESEQKTMTARIFSVVKISSLTQ